MKLLFTESDLVKLENAVEYLVHSEYPDENEACAFLGDLASRLRVYLDRQALVEARAPELMDESASPAPSGRPAVYDTATGSFVIRITDLLESSVGHDVQLP